MEVFISLLPVVIIGSITVWYYFRIYQPSKTNNLPKPLPTQTYVSEKKCSSCAMMIPKEASICPYCRTKQGFTLGNAIAILVFILIFSAIITSVNSKYGPDAPPPQPTSQNIEQAQGSDAKYAAKEFVTDHLKAPSTAKFPYYEEFAAAKQANGTWQVMGYVDAQNSYGAMLRQQFLCTLKKTGDKWYMVDLKMPY